MQELPVIGCELDEAALAAQLGRYRALAGDVAAAEREDGRLSVAFGPGVDRALLAEAVAVERGCCSFLALDVAGDRLTVELHVDGITSRMGNDMLTVRAEVRTEDGEQVTTGRCTLVVRGEDA